MGPPAAPPEHNFCYYPEAKFLTWSIIFGLAESVTWNVCNLRYYCSLVCRLENACLTLLLQKPWRTTAIWAYKQYIKTTTPE